MIKLIGAAMIAAACALGCATVLKEQRGRVRELRSLCTALAMMRREMSLNLTALPELSKKLSESCGEPAAGFFRMTWLMCEELGDFEFCGIWRLCIGKCFARLRQDELYALETLGAVLGRFALEAQLKAIDDCEETLSGKLNEYMSVRKEENRLKLGLMCAGCALILIVLA